MEQELVSGFGMEVSTDQELIPGLPNELVVDCILTKVSWQHLISLSSVSRGWLSTIQSRGVYQARIRTASAQKLVVVLHKVPAVKFGTVSLPYPTDDEPFTYLLDEEESTGEALVLLAVPRLDDDFPYLLEDDDEEIAKEVPEPLAYALSLHSPCDNAWQQLPSIPNVACGIPLFSEFACVKGKLFVLGGRDQETWQPRNEVYMLDLVAGNGVWQERSSMITARASFACGVIGDKVYVAGGHSDISRTLSTAEMYNPETNVWEPVADMHGPRSCCAVAIWDKSMYVIGGYTRSEHEDILLYEELDDSDDDAEWADSAEVYDASKGEWRQLGNMKNEYDGQVCTVVNGSLYSFSTLGVEKFDPATNSWQQMYKVSWHILCGDGSTPQSVLSVAAVENEVFAVICLGDDFEWDRGCALLKSKGFGKPGQVLSWEPVMCPPRFRLVGPFPALGFVEV